MSQPVNPDRSSDPDYLEALEEVLRLRAAGQLSTESIRGRYPHHADRILEELAILERLDHPDPRGLPELGEQRGARTSAAAAEGEKATAFLSGLTIGPYRIEREIGRGGQGVVYLAEDTRLSRRVALKMLTAAAAQSPAHRSRLLREAEAASKVDHPGICTVLDIGEQDDVPYIAMRYVEGESLAQRIAAMTKAESSPESTGTTTSSSRRDDVLSRVELIERVARALHAAHQRGLIHRDVKPGNILVTPDGDPVLVDFGLARDLKTDLLTVTQTGQLMGTPAYMAPEQLASGRIYIDARADLFSLGVTLFEFLTGKIPFDAPTRDQMFMKILTVPPPDPRQWNAAIPSDLKVVLDIVLEKDRERRYQSAAAFADDLRRVRKSEPILARPISPVIRLQRWVRRRPALAALLAVSTVGALLIAALCGYIIARRGDIEVGVTVRQQRAIEARLERGFLNLGEGSARDAVSAFAAALELDPTCVEAVAGKTLALLRTEKAADALAFLDQNRDLASSHPALLQVRADALRASGRPEAASEVEANLEPPRTAVGHFILGQRALLRGHGGHRTAPARAFEHISQAMLLNAESARALFHFERAHAASHAGHHEAAVRTAKGMTRLWPDSDHGWFIAGMAYKGAGDGKRAIEAYREAVAMRPDFSPYHAALGEALQRFGHHDEATAACREAIRLDPKNVGNHIGLGWVFVGQRKLENGLTCFRDAIRLAPENASAHLQLGVTFFLMGEHGKALEAIETAIRLRPHYADAYYHKGNTLLSQGDTEGAAAAQREAIRLNPSLDSARVNLCVALRKLGRLSEALATIRAALARNPRTPGAHLNLGMTLRSMGRVRGAIEALQQGIRLEPKRAFLHVKMGLALASIKKNEESLRHLEEAIRLGSNDADTWYQLGNGLRAVGEFEKAIHAFREAVERNPSHAESHCNLGITLSQSDAPVEAVAAIRRGHALGSRRPSWQYSSDKWVRNAENRLLRWAQDETAAADAAGGGEPPGAARGRALQGLETLLAGWPPRSARADDRDHVKRLVREMRRTFRALIEGRAVGMGHEEKEAWRRFGDTLDRVVAALREN